jgi:hypothetical protein
MALCALFCHIGRERVYALLRNALFFNLVLTLTAGLLLVLALNQLVHFLDQEIKCAVLRVNSFLDTVKDQVQLVELGVLVFLDVVGIQHPELLLEFFLGVRQMLGSLVEFEEIRQIGPAALVSDLVDNVHGQVFEDTLESHLIGLVEKVC